MKIPYFCFPENEEHGITLILPGVFQSGIFQNISKKTVTIALR